MGIMIKFLVFIGFIVLPFIVLIPFLIRYTKNIEILISIYLRMFVVNFFTGLALAFVFHPIIFCYVDEALDMFILGLLMIYIPVIYYPYFYSELHYECPRCGSRHTVKLDDSDGEYFDMDFHCKQCHKNFTIERKSIGGWGD